MIDDGAIKGAPPKPPVVNRNRVASTLWDDLCPQLVEAGILSRVDGMLLACLCLAYAQLVRAMKELDGTEPTGERDADGKPKKRQKSWCVLGGSGGLKSHPMLQVAQNARNDIARYSDQIGLTPTARARIATLGRAGDGTIAEEDRDLEDILA